MRRGVMFSTFDLDVSIDNTSPTPSGVRNILCTGCTAAGLVVGVLTELPIHRQISPVQNYI